MKKVVEILHGAGHYVTLLSSVNNKVQTVPDGVTLKEFDYGVKSEALENVWTEVRVIDRLRAVSKLSQDMLLFCEKLGGRKLKPKRRDFCAAEVFDRIDVIDWMRVEKFEIAITSGVTCFQPLLRLAGIQRSVVVTSAEPAPWITRRMGMPSSGAFSEIPDTTFIWHLQEHTPLNQSNVVLVPKLPERDLLADPRVIAIINDGRTNSLHDVAFGGKPVVCIPSDQAQLRNCHQLKKRGLALVRNCRDITPDDVKKMIEEAATNEVRNSAKMFSKEVTSRTTSPEERLTRAVEFAAKYGGSVDLNSNDDSVGVMQRYNLDVFLPIAVLLAVIGLLIAWIARTLWIKCKKSTMVESNGTSDITDLPRDGAESKKPSTAELEREEPASSIDSEVTE
ncbi:hypothetical protein NECAME_02825 [Necator americanus]|uniref:glucuronosyltransferase n=1 Tax=Necator americanus TaxID=51031 RepID=W2T9Y8_NECAM|nr:hypothetical protein NECAME_02825 [Necator americanus]ETN78678.1 hypothetical protein NECAME_02825 [Necator americanus]